MKPRILSREQFGEQLLLALTKRFAEGREEMSFQEVGHDYLRTSVSIEVIMTAKKKKSEPEPEPEPCCICVRSGQGFICHGECCFEVFPDAGNVDPI